MHSRSRALARSFAVSLAPFAVLAGLARGLPALAQEKADPTAKEQKKEDAALGHAVDELLKLAKACEQAKDYADARAELERALVVSPGAKKAEAELAKVASKDGKASASFAAKLAKERTKAHEKAANLLADQALAWKKAGAQDRSDRLCGLIHEGFPDCEKALAKAGAAWFAPYYQLVSLEDAKKLEAGGDEVSGKWLDAGAVESENKKHASWNDPWVISDDVHELKTTAPLRTAKRLLKYVALYRTFFLEKFGRSWDLKAPSGKLPIVLTETQADLRARMSAEAERLGGKMNGPTNGAAYYMQTNGELNPCFVTFEPQDATGRVFKVDFEGVLLPFEHELTHQICFEYSKHDCDRTRTVANQFWAVEGLATFMQHYAYKDGRWVLTHPRKIAMGGGFIEGAFAYCKANQSSLPTIAQFTAIPREKFMTVENYHIAATLAYFLLEGEKGKYRDAFVKLLETVHKVHDAPDTWDTCFKGVDKGAMQREWNGFVTHIPLDD